jgi:hypothetical protein
MLALFDLDEDGERDFSARSREESFPSPLADLSSSARRSLRRRAVMDDGDLGGDFESSTTDLRLDLELGESATESFDGALLGVVGRELLLDDDDFDEASSAFLRVLAGEPAAAAFFFKGLRFKHTWRPGKTLPKPNAPKVWLFSNWYPLVVSK